MMPLKGGTEKSPKTHFICFDDECDFNKVDEDYEKTITLAGTWEAIQNRLSRKVDKELRNRGLKI
jgi:hypothetical protein